MSKAYYTRGRDPNVNPLLGRPRSFTDEKLLWVLTALGEESRTIPLIAWMLGVKENTVYYRLRLLETDGKVRCVGKVGKQVLWGRT